MAQDYYKILGVDKGASDADIKKAFHSLSKKWHPDKFATGTDTEKKEAETKFKEINEAYQTLSDKTKREEYDNPGMGGFSFNFGGKRWDPFHGQPNPWDPFGGNPWGQRTIRKGAGVRAHDTVTIDDLLSGNKYKTIRYKINRRCPVCHGAGGDHEICPDCHGEGVLSKTQRHGNMVFTQQSMCVKCGGTGRIVKNACSNCAGTGFVPEDKSVQYDISSMFLSVPSTDYSYPGYGSESPDKDGPSGDLIISVHPTIDKNVWRFDDKNNIYRVVDIPWYDALLGKHIHINLPLGKSIDIDVPANTHDNASLRKVGMGPFGKDWFTVVRYSYPSLSGDSLKLVEKIRDNESGSNK